MDGNGNVVDILARIRGGSGTPQPRGTTMTRRTAAITAAASLCAALAASAFVARSTASTSEPTAVPILMYHVITAAPPGAAPGLERSQNSCSAPYVILRYSEGSPHNRVRGDPSEYLRVTHPRNATPNPKVL